MQLGYIYSCSLMRNFLTIAYLILLELYCFCSLLILFISMILFGRFGSDQQHLIMYLSFMASAASCLVVPLLAVLLQRQNQFLSCFILTMTTLVFNILPTKFWTDFGGEFIGDRIILSRYQDIVQIEEPTSTPVVYRSDGTDHSVGIKLTFTTKITKQGEYKIGVRSDEIFAPASLVLRNPVTGSIVHDFMPQDRRSNIDQKIKYASLPIGEYILEAVYLPSEFRYNPHTGEFSGGGRHAGLNSDIFPIVSVAGIPSEFGKFPYQVEVFSPQSRVKMKDPYVTYKVKGKIKSAAISRVGYHRLLLNLDI